MENKESKPTVSEFNIKIKEEENLLEMNNHFPNLIVKKESPSVLNQHEIKLELKKPSAVDLSTLHTKIKLENSKSTVSEFNIKIKEEENLLDMDNHFPNLIIKRESPNLLNQHEIKLELKEPSTVDSSTLHTDIKLENSKSTVSEFNVKIKEEENLLDMNNHFPNLIIKRESPNLLNQHEIKLEFKEPSAVDLSTLHTEIKLENGDSDISRENSILFSESGENSTELNIFENTFEQFNKTEESESSIDSETLIKQTSLKNYQKIHHDQKKFNCNICLKTFVRLSHLKIHERTHTGEKPFKCHTCFKTFFQSGDLKRHERIHTGEKPFKCNLCFKTFTELGSLRRHKRIRSCEKPYKCHVCFKTFPRLDNLEIHQGMHIGKKSF